jgi:dihydroxyacetone kinase
MQSEIEIGMGIHNESGVRRIPVASLRELVPQLLDLIISTSDVERSYLPFKGDGTDCVVLMVNNLGSVSELEMGAIVREASYTLAKRNIAVRRILAGTFMASTRDYSNLTMPLRFCAPDKP